MRTPPCADSLRTARPDRGERMLPRLVYCKKAEGTLPALRLGSLLRFQLLPPAVGLRKDALRSWVPQGRTKATRLSKTFRMRRSLRQMDSFIGSATCVLSVVRAKPRIVFGTSKDASQPQAPRDPLEGISCETFHPCRGGPQRYSA